MHTNPPIYREVINDILPASPLGSVYLIVNLTAEDSTSHFIRDWDLVELFQ